MGMASVHCHNVPADHTLLSSVREKWTSRIKSHWDRCQKAAEDALPARSNFLKSLCTLHQISLDPLPPRANLFPTSNNTWSVRSGVTTAPEVDHPLPTRGRRTGICLAVY